MAPRRLVLLVAAVLALQLTGCSDDSDRPEPKPAAPSATTPSGTTPSPTENSSGAEPAVGTIVDPCELLEPRDYRSLFAKDAGSVLNEQVSLRSTFMECSVRIGLVRPLHFGFSLEPGAYRRALRQHGPFDGETGAELPGIGDEAFIARALVGVDAYARSGDVTFVLSTGFGTEATAAEIVGALAVMALAGDEVSSTPVDLPPNCPAADARVVTDLIGPVAYARGGQHRDGSSACGYTSTTGRTLQTTYTFLDGASFEVEYENDGLDNVVLDPPPGVTKDWSRGSDNSFTLFAMYPRQLLHLEIKTDGLAMPRPQATRRFLDFCARYLRTNEPGAAGAGG